jgi:hypothetical protein
MKKKELKFTKIKAGTSNGINNDKFNLSILKFIFLAIILTISFKLNFSMPFLLTVGYIVLSLFWNWEIKTNLIAGSLILIVYHLLKIARQNLIIEDLDICGWLFVGSYFAVLLLRYWKNFDFKYSVKKSFVEKIKYWQKINFEFSAKKNLVKKTINFLSDKFHKISKILIFIRKETIKATEKFLDFYQKKIEPKPLWTKLRAAIIIFLICFLLLRTEWQIINIIIFVFFISALLFRWFWADRVFFIFALILLASCPVLLIQEKEIQAEIAAIYAYYFLVIGVILQISEFSKFSFSEIKQIFIKSKQIIKKVWIFLESE